MSRIAKPKQNEYNSFYQGYLDTIGEADVLNFLEKQLKDFVNLLESYSEKDLRYAYAEGKWTLAEVIGHIIDAERIFAYRALCISRKELASLPGFDQNDYVNHSNYKNRSLNSLKREFQSLRISNLEMIVSMDDAQYAYTGTMNGAECSVRALVYVMAGHLQHHFYQLKKNYTPN